MTSPRITIRTRGQTVLLGVLTLLMLSVMMMLTFSVNQVVHEKIRIQAHSDAIAYSSAVIDARAFNSMVYTNRAIAAGIVAQTSLHAWMATVSSTAAILASGAQAFGMIAGFEFIEAGFCPFPCCVAIHCVHMAEATMIAIAYFMKSMDYGNKIQGMESKFNTAVESLSKMVTDLHAYQDAVLGLAVANLTSIGNTLTTINAQRSTVQPSVAGQNSGNFACALEGSLIESMCLMGPAKSSAGTRSIVMQNAANALRPPYDQMITLVDSHEDFLPDSDFLKDIQHNIGDPVTTKLGVAFTGEDKGLTSDSSAEGKAVSAMEMVSFMSDWRDTLPGMGGLMAWIVSDANGGDHFPPWVHSGNHDKFKGLQPDDICTDNCFVNFRSSEDPDKDFAQPTAYGAVKYATLWERQSGSGRAANAWLVNDQGTIELDTGGGSTAKVKMIPSKPGYAVSKAKAYFHQIGDWQAPPNFFDPFWRAKLHPFSRQEITEQAGAAMDSDGTSNAATLPIEGDTR